MIVLFGGLEDDFVDDASVVEGLVLLHGDFVVLFADGSLNVDHLLRIAAVAFDIGMLHFRR